MTFLFPQVLLWLPAVALLVVVAVLGVRVAAARRTRVFGAQAARLAPSFAPGRRLLRDGLLVLAVGLCVVALARPQFGTSLREMQQRGVDVMIVLDTSRSMLARDVPPSRLDRAKREVRGLLDRLHGDRVGLVTFAGNARQICPLTADPSTFRLFLDDVDTTSNSTGGTAIGEGLEKALDSFDPTVTGARVIVLLSDGEDHDSDPPPSEVAYRAKAAGIPIHVVSFGTDAGSELPIVDERGHVGVVLDAQDKPVVSKPDEALLEGIATVADGSFLSAARTPFPLDEIWEKRIATMEGVTRDSSTRREGVNRYQWALMLALALLAVRALLPDGRAAAGRARRDGGRADASGANGGGTEAAAANGGSANGGGESGGSANGGGVRAGRAVAAVLLLALLAPGAAADEDRGMQLLREALDALARQDPQAALKLCEEARPDLPGSTLLANVTADSQRMLEQWDAALGSYVTGAQGEYAHRALFNAGVTAAAAGEAALAEAAVPADVAALPEGPQPEMLKALKAAQPRLAKARTRFLDALDVQPDDGAARESIAAINRRADAVAAMRTELERREREQQQQQQKQDDKQNQDNKDQDKKDQQDKQDQQQQDQQDESSQDQPPQDQEPSEDDQKQKDEQGQQDEQQPPDASGEPQESPDDAQGGTPQEASLGKEQIQQLLDRLEELEEKGRQLQKLREAARRHPVEKDW